MKLDNHIIPFQLGGNRVRGSIVRLGTAVSEIIADSAIQNLA